MMDALKTLIGSQNYIDKDVDMEPYATPWRGALHAMPSMVVFPQDTKMVQAILRYCNDTKIAVIPEGGNTNLSESTIVTEDRESIILNLSRMRNIIALNKTDRTLLVESGVVLEVAKEYVADAGLYFPLSIASEGSAMIGGNIATNAGGVNVLRYGHMRHLVLGVEAVLASGEIFSDIRGLRKDNSGYNLSQLIVGSEGTLAVVTKAMLSLSTLPNHREILWCTVDTPVKANQLLTLAQHMTDERVSAFEIMSKSCIDTVIGSIANASLPVQTAAAYHILLEATTTHDKEGLKRQVEALVTKAFDAQLVTDGVMAQTGMQATALWRLREDISEASKKTSTNAIYFDLAVAPSAIPAFMDQLEQLQSEHSIISNILLFGHMGDGNIHLHLHLSHDDVKDISTIQRVIYELTEAHQGSFSAEHGIGIKHLEAMQRYKSETTLMLMRNIKSVFDPNNILNPGKLIPSF